uniref:Uncharacterized protein n=1 Tax=Rhizophora mucronata TaxID=61149 RepID=A0A2P2PED5_RHIMU
MSSMNETHTVRTTNNSPLIQQCPFQKNKQNIVHLAATEKTYNILQALLPV